MKISKEDVVNILIIVSGISALLSIILMCVYLFTMANGVLAFSKWMMGTFGFSMIGWLAIELREYL